MSEKEENNIFNYIGKYIIDFLPSIEKLCFIDYEYDDNLSNQESNSDYEHISDKNDYKDDISELDNDGESESDKSSENIINLYCKHCDESIDNYKYIITACDHYYHIECIINKLKNLNENKSDDYCSYCEDIFTIL